MDDSSPTTHPAITTKQMQRGIPLMFIDSIVPDHQRMNYAVISDIAGENPGFEPQSPFHTNFKSLRALPRRVMVPRSTPTITSKCF